MKRFFALAFSVVFIFALVVICFAHPGGTDENGGHYDRSTGEYHYHHGYSAHQHEDGICPYEPSEYECNSEGCPDNSPHYHVFLEEETETEKEYALAWFYVEADNLEDVILNEFEGEEGEEIRDVIISNSDCEILEIGLTRYIEYESLRDVATKEYSEDIADIITSHEDLIKLTPDDIMEKCDIDENDDIPEEDIAEYEDENDIRNKQKKQYDLGEILFAISIAGFGAWGAFNIYKDVKNS